VFILPRFTREDEFDRSRGAPLRPSYGKKRIVRRERRMDSIRTPQFPIRTGTKRTAKNERRWWCLRFRLRQAKKEKYRRRNADRRKASSAVPYGHGRASIVRRTSIGVPPRFSSQGVFHRKGLSLRPCFLGRDEQVWPVPSSGCYPPRSVPSPATAPCALVVVPGGVMPKAARERVASPRAGAALAAAARHACRAASD
jgi:hypothetical protein